MKKLLLLVVSSLTSHSSFAINVTQIKLKVSLGLTRCDDRIKDGMLQNCVNNNPNDQEILYDLNLNCKKVSDGEICASSNSLTTQMDHGSATATIIISKNKISGYNSIVATVLLTPGMNLFQLSSMTLEIPESGALPSKIELGASSFKVKDDSRLYIPSVTIK